MDAFQKSRWLRVFINFLLIGGAVVLIRAVSVASSDTTEVTYSEFRSDIRAGRFVKVEITDKTLRGTVRDPKAEKASVVIAGRLPEVDDASLLKDLEAQGVQVSGRFSGGSQWVSLFITWIFPVLILLIVSRYLAGGMSRGAITFGQSRARIYDQSSQTKVTFGDVAGVEEAKTELLEVVDFLRNPKRYQALGGRIPKGVLLVGPPGTGKTLLARAVAGEAGVAFFSISGSEFVEMFVCVGAARVRDLFDQAKSKAPCIIFIDELDAIGKSRSAGTLRLNNDEREQTLNQLLAEMDGFETTKGVILMAATNTPEILDPALLRGGRFDRQVILDRPDVQGRLDILRVHARQIKTGRHVDLELIAARTPGMVGSDLATIMNEAALLAARHAKVEVEMADVEEAVDRVMLGMEKKRQVMSAEEKRRVAFHESGHALVALSVEHADRVERVSIIPRTIGAIGYTLQLPLHDRYLMTQPELEDQIAVMLGGRAAEELIYDGVISSGAADDLERASALLRQVITRFGMSPALGTLTWGEPAQSKYLQSVFETEQRSYSDKTAQLIDEEKRRMVEEIYKRVKAILAGRREQLEAVANELIRRETLSRKDLDEVLSVK